MRILVVDDSKAVHSYITDCFHELHHNVEHVYNGAEALKKLLDAPGFDIMLLDWEMPVMNGPELLGKMKEEKILTPVIMMTTKNSTADITRMLESGVSEYIMKPFTQDIVFEKIESVVGMKVSGDVH